MRMHAGEDDTDVDEVNAEFVEVEALVKESSQVGRKELVKEVKEFLRSGASRRYLTGHFKISGTQQRLALNKILSYIPYKARLLLAPFCFVPESSWLNYYKARKIFIHISRLWRVGPVENKCGQPSSKPGGGGHQRYRPQHRSFESQVL